ncbi:MAG: hybrid sensor histidine kinase/response regulator [Rivularia sp. (in: Bacteria)]|nr:hybrid sensor histidine kinase/response regulator [Rivularia sp. MS3]
MSTCTSNSGFILLVDDNPTNLAVLAQTLKNAGLSIRIETDGESAIEQLEDEIEQPELILLDVQMPGIDGFETCRRIKANPQIQEIPIIFMTALSDTDSKVKGLSLGAVDYITKPFEGEEVLARVRVHLQLRHLTKKLANWNEQLEKNVAERTAALQQTQVQLVQQEKFATIGQLVAGVAHEINNPIGCISSNVAPAYEYLEDIMQIIHLYQKHYPQPVAEIESALEDLDIEFALNDFPNLLESIKVSSQRIKDISVSMRNFSRNDTNKLVKADIHTGIDSTLMILRHRLKAVGSRPEIKVIKNYSGFTGIQCYPGLLNQVFTNLIANAIDALENVTAPCIHISTEKTITDKIIIRIADNGMGMTQEVLQKLFEPLFTTKPLGKGTGLGMAIAKQIIEETHQGTLSVSSEIGKKTEFTIEIPIIA